MGDGKNLKKYLDEKGTNVRKIAKATGISATTLYSKMSVKLQKQLESVLQPYIQSFKKIPIFDLILL